MKKNSILLALLFVIAVFSFSACSKEDSIKEEQSTEQIVQFRIMEEGFGADNEITRSSADFSKPTITEFEDCEAESTVEDEPAEQTVTRAITTPTHYTIRIYKDGELKGEFKGMFSGSTFTPDAGTPEKIRLTRKNTYTFVCFNDQVTPNGDKLEVALADAATARIGKQQITLGTTDEAVSLTAKHVGVRVRTQITARKHIPTAITATLQSKGNNIPQRVSYNPVDGSYTNLSNTTMAATANNSPASTQEIYTASNHGYNYSYTSTADYHYFLPITDIANLKLNITGGQIFWKQIVGSINKLNGWDNRPLQSNGTYLIKVKMSPQYTYLMNDGTTGSYKETKSYGGTKEAVGIVINQDKQLAIALNPALGFIQWAITTDQYDQEQVSKNTKTTVVEALAIESGYDETWNANTSIDNTTVKATSEKLPAFKAVGDYVPTKSSGYAINISGSLVGKKWHMPSMDEWKYVFETLGFGDVSELTKTVYPTPKWYGMLVHNAFARFGNNRFTDIGISCYTCTEYNDKGKTSDAFDVHPKYADMEFGWTYKAYGGRVYPFIYY